MARTAVWPRSAYQPPISTSSSIRTLHDDHCTGNFRRLADGARAPAFPNAEYLVQRREYDDAINLNERTRATYSPRKLTSRCMNRVSCACWTATPKSRPAFRQS